MKPAWPHARVTRMTAHANGQWCKKIHGKLKYFGPWDNPDGALDRWRMEHGGIVPATDKDVATVKEVVNAWLTAKRSAMDAGELSPRTFRDYLPIGRIVADTLGRSTPVASLTGSDWARLRKALPGKAIRIGNAAVWIRGMFRWACEHGMILAPSYGGAMDRPPRRLLRQQRRESAAPFTPREIRKLARAARAPVRAMILLAVNAGMTQTDISQLRISAIDFKTGMVEYARPKTEIDRRFWLWPLTAKAITDAIACRPRPRDSDHADLVFLTAFGKPWVRVVPGKETVGISDAVAGEFRKVCQLAGVRPRGFGRLRHAFATAADEAGDFHAAERVMGHALPGMADVYIDAIGDHRLVSVARVVWKWLIKRTASPSPGVGVGVREK